MNLNFVQIIGRLTAKPELRMTPNGSQVASFRVANNRTWKDKQGQKKEEAEFHSVVAFGRTAENIATYFEKGDEIFIQGRLKTSSWDDKNGGKRYKTDIIAEKFDFGQKARQNASQGAKMPIAEPGRPAAKVPVRSSAKSKAPVEEDIPVIEDEDYGPDEGGIDVKDIPF